MVCELSHQATIETFYLGENKKKQKFLFSSQTLHSLSCLINPLNDYLKLSYSESIMLLQGFQWFAMPLVCVCVRVHMSVWSFCWAYSEGSEVWWPAIGRGLFKWSPWILPFKDTFEQAHCNKYSHENFYTYAQSSLIYLFYTYKPNNGTQLYLWFSKEMDWMQSISSKVCVTFKGMCDKILFMSPLVIEALWDVPILWSVLSTSVKQRHKWEEPRDKCRTAQLWTCYAQELYAYLVFCNILQVSLG